MSTANTESQKMVTKTIVTSPHIYKPVGPYSQAILADKTLYVSGMLGLDTQAQLVCGGAEAQIRQALENLKHVLAAGGSSLEAVVTMNILLVNIDDFEVVNRVYAQYFPKNCPARATYQVSKLPLGAAVEIVATALSGDLVIAEAGLNPCARI
ncbi:2-iminobutanoate/2-iminopropanoate deaminase-like [Pararge aegeria]|uniref:Jg25340 protein n=1 Tax=Pararge aegeria aegeria TaxID=348720 RepID=A0A8S4S4L9_9NEOP|nr:2-iminobutanoate/2-iminopropanoate deaminase-like [Pararge aegeria]CAH2244391.1 jg25340 [Pararge aegeria aegeria]